MVGVSSASRSRGGAEDPVWLRQTGPTGDPESPQKTKGKREMATHTANTAAADSGSVGHLQLADRVRLLRAMLLMRGLEERAMSLYRQGKVPGSFYDGFGQEAVSAGGAHAMAAGDRLCILHRDLAAHIIRGVSPVRILAQYMGRAAGITAGRDGNVHFGDRELGCVGMVSMLDRKSTRLN